MSKKEQSNITVASPRRFTLRKSRILRGKRHFQPLFADGTLIHSPMVTLRYLINENPESGFMAGFIAPKRTGKAVDRNRSKRLLRESFRLQQYTISDTIEDLKMSVHMVFIAKHTLTNAAQVQQQMATLIEKLRTRLLSQTSPT